MGGKGKVKGGSGGGGGGGGAAAAAAVAAAAATASASSAPSAPSTATAATAPTKATKKALGKYEAGLEAARRVRVKAAAWKDGGGEVPRNVLLDLPPAFCKYTKGGADVEATFGALGEAGWSAEVEGFAFDVTKGNMREIYAGAPGWEWNDVKKRGELFDSETRFVFVRNGAGAAAAPGALVGLLAFRFLSEGDYEVLYIYELQVAPAAQHRGIGRYLMMLGEAVARKTGMQKVMLTVLKNNAAARDFYAKLKYEAVEECPEDAPYEILSKGVDAAAIAAIEARRNILAAGMLPADA